jgi:hypothetical protein
MHLALVHQASLVRVHELNRILDRDDVVVARAFDVVDQRAEHQAAAAGKPHVEQRHPERFPLQRLERL